ncbi:hypothetical protein L1987_17966 [Smallanthus sonchifolius]|uniref:Uncharacterized protein n=1 Tax=Smallanthus sonchifolius TaxID=185202 RepID=A0ACB9IYU4_9ASTR|nr:hypothetical protein L1987_17966 [Smallanthus sonchifolius]
MAQNNGFEDIESINRPPRLVSGEDYDMWKNRMESFFCYQEYGMWKSIKDGPYTPMVSSADSGGTLVPKETSKYSDEDIKKMEVDFKALGAIQMCLPNEVFHNFRDELQCSKVKLENEDILKKFIRSLPSCWTLYTVSIRRTENLKTLQMTELFGMLKTYELEMIQAKERRSSYQTASTSTTTSSVLHSNHSGPSSSNYYPPIVTHPQTPTSQTNTSPFLLEAPPQTSTSAVFVSENSRNMSFIKEDLECFHPDDLEEMDIQHSYAMLSIRAKRFYSRTGRPIPTQTAACAAVGTSDFDWSFQYEDLPANNQALMADTTEIPPQVYEHLCSQACIDKVLGYRKHNQNLIDQNEEFHQMKSEFTKVENSYKEKNNCLKKEISLLKHEQTNLETQIDDLLARLKATRAELAEQKVHVDKYEFASKNLQRLLDAQIHDNVKTGLEYHAELYQVVAPPADYVAIHEPSFNLSNLEKANRNLDPSRNEPFVQECSTSSDSESTCLESTKTETSSPDQEPAPPVLEVIQTSAHVPFISSVQVPAVPAPTPLNQIKISYPPEGRKLTVEKGQSSNSINSKPQRKVFDICHAPGERVPYVQKTLEEATFEHNKAHLWKFKDLFKRKDYVYLSRDKLAKSFFVCGKYNHTASTCFYYLQQQKNIKQHAFEKTNKNKQIRSFEAKTTQFRNSLSPPRKQLSKPQQNCIICGESDHFAANCKFNPFNQILHQAPHKQKPTSKRTSTERPYVNKVKKDQQASVVDPSAASKNVGNQVKPKKTKDKPSAATKSDPAPAKSSAAKSAADKPNPSAATKSATDKLKSSAAKSAADKPKPSAATKSAADKLKSSAAKSTADKANPSAAKARSAADREKKIGKPPSQQWKAKISAFIPPRIIIDKECFVLSPGLSKPPPEKILLTAKRKENLYVLDMNEVTPSGNVSCFLSKASVDESALWHRRLSHVNIKTINKLVKDNLVRGLPDKEFQLEDHCIA